MATFIRLTLAEYEALNTYKAGDPCYMNMDMVIGISRHPKDLYTTLYVDNNDLSFTVMETPEVIMHLMLVAKGEA